MRSDQPAGVLVAGGDMRYLAVSASACRLLGYSQEELLRLRVTDVAVSSDAKDLFTRLVEEGSQAGITPLRRADGGTVIVGYEAVELRIGAVPVFVSVIIPRRESSPGVSPQQVGGSKRGTGGALSPRELDVLQLLANGLDNDEIAAQLDLSVETVKSNVRRVLAKLDARSRTHAVAVGLRRGLVS